MIKPLSHSDYEELLGAYALDATDVAETAAVELHLRECPRCRDEVARHRETAALLGHAGATAPEGLWDRIAGNLREAPPALALVRAPKPGPLAAPGATPPAAGVAPSGVAPSGVAPPMAVLRWGAKAGPGAPAGRRRRVGVRPVVALVSAAAIVIGILGFELSSLQGQVSQVRSSLSGGTIQRLATVALGIPGRETVNLRSANQGLASAVITPDGQGYLVDAKLPQLPSTETYQLWGLLGGKAISLGLLGTSPAQASFHVASGQLTELMITVERAGGVQLPDNSAVVSGTPIAD